MKKLIVLIFLLCVVPMNVNALIFTQTQVQTLEWMGIGVDTAYLYIRDSREQEITHAQELFVQDLTFSGFDSSIGTLIEVNINYIAWGVASWVSSSVDKRL